MKFKGVALILLTVFLTACSFNGDSTMNPFPREADYAMETTADYAPSPMEEANLDTSSQTERSVIYNASVTYETIDYAQAKEQLFEIIDEGEGNIQYQDEYSRQYQPYSEGAFSLKQLYLIVRVGQDNYSKLINQLENSEFANLIQSSKGSEDVTSLVRDLEIRIESVDARIDRLNELNEEADTVADLIEIETALQNAILERDQLLEQQSSLNEQVDMATINISLNEVLELSDGGGSQITFWDQFQAAMVETWYRALDAIQMGIISLVFLIPYIIFLLILLAILRWILIPILRSFRGKSKKNKKSKIKDETNDQTDNNGHII